MRRIVMWLAVTVTVVVLLFSYRTSTGPRGGTVAAGPAAPAGVVGGPGSRAPGQVVTVNGTVARTRWGPLQVQIKVADGRLTDVVVLQQPTGSSTDQAINGFALPQLRAQALAAQSAHIAGVSGATVTTGGYLESLQAAIDAAKVTGTPTGTVPPPAAVPPSIAAGSDD